jgi:hypothetical protein
VHSTFEYLAWLLSDDAAWLPPRIASKLIEGIRARGLWFNELDDFENALAQRLFGKTRKAFRLTRSVRAAAVALFAEAASTLRLSTSAETLAERFVDHDLVGGW